MNSDNNTYRSVVSGSGHPARANAFQRPQYRELAHLMAEVERRKRPLEEAVETLKCGLIAMGQPARKDRSW
jgi:hypothetical protein